MARTGLGLLSRLNRAYKEDIGNVLVTKREKLSGLSRLARYKELQESDEMVSILIDYSDSETGDLYHYDAGNVCCVITSDEVKKLFPGYVPRGNSYLLGTHFKAKVKAVDEEQGIVEFYAVSNDEVTLEQYKKKTENIRAATSEGEALRRVLMNALNEDNRKPLVRGTVTKVEAERIYLDLFDKGLIAVVPVHNYAEEYRRDLRDEVQVGDSLKGVVFAYRAKPGEDEKHFVVSTAAYVPDPWKKESIKRLKPGDIIVIKCVGFPPETRQRAEYFWGHSNVLKGIDILCDYTTKVPKGDVLLGAYYKCKIGKLDFKKRKITVSPYERSKAYDER